MDYVWAHMDNELKPLEPRPCRAFLLAVLFVWAMVLAPLPARTMALPAIQAPPTVRASGNFSWPAKAKIPLVRGTILAATGWDGRALTSTATIPDATIALGAVNASFTATAALKSLGKTAEITSFLAGLAPLDPTEGAPFLPKMAAGGSGVLNPDGSLRLDLASLEVGDLARLSGRVRLEAGGRLSLELSGPVNDLGRLIEQASPLAPGLERLRASGTGRLTISAAFEGNRTILDFSLQGRRMSLSADGGSPGLTFSGLEGRVLLDGRPGELSIRGNILAEGLLGTGRAGLPDPSLSLNATAKDGPDNSTRVALRRLNLDFPPGLKVGNATLPVDRVHVSGSVLVHGNGTWSFRDERISLPGLGSISVTARGEPSGRIHADLSSDELSLTDLGPAVLAALGKSPEGWNFAGTAGMEASLSAGEGTFSARAEADLSGGGFVSPTGQAMGDKLAGSLTLRAYRSGKRIRADLDLPSGELLLGASYLSLGKHPLTLSANRDAPGFTVQAEMDGLFRAGVRGRETGDGSLGGNATLEYADLGRAMDIVLGGDSDLRFGGRASSDLAFRSVEDGWAAWGRATLANATVARNNATLLVDSSLDLPVRLASGSDFRPRFFDSLLTPGALDVGEFGLGPLSSEGFRLSAALAPEGLFLDGLADMRIFGAPLKASSIRVQNLLSTPRAFAEVEAGPIDLSDVPTGGVPLEGSLRSRHLEITATRKQVNVEGRIKGRLFGGNATITGMAVDNPLSSARIIRADVDVERMHLDRISRALGVGLITGRLDLTLKNLAMAYGQPLSFKLRAESVEVPGVGQDVSLKAINSLAVIGTGSGMTSLGTRMFATFFREFPYEKIGMAASLNNDLFRIQGLVEEGGREFLIKKPLFFGVNVVNSNPDNLISFSDMMKRVKRVVRPSDGEDSAGEDNKEEDK